MTDACHLVLGPGELNELLLAEQERMSGANPGLRVVGQRQSGGLAENAVAIVGMLSGVAGLSTFVEWCDGKLRRQSFEVTVVGSDDVPRTIRVSVPADSAELRHRILDAFGDETA